MKTLHAQIKSMFLLWIGLSVLASGLFVTWLLEKSYRDSLMDRAAKEGALVASALEEGLSGESHHKVAERFGRTLDARVMFVDREGKLLGDSQKDAGEIPLHRHPEVRRALEQSPEQPIPYVKDGQIHVVSPVVRGAGEAGAVLIVYDPEKEKTSLRQVGYSLVGGLAVAYILAAYASSRLANRLTSPLAEIAQVAVDIAQKQFHRRVKVRGRDEIARLGEAINRMAKSLQTQMEALHQSERRLTSVIDTMDSGLLLVDADGKVNLANRAFEDMIGVQARKIMGKSYTQLTYPYELVSLITRCRETGDRVREEIHLYYPVERILSAHFAPMKGEKKAKGAVGVFHDITAIRRLEKMRSEFVANVSHELKTPITSLRGFAETLLDGAMHDSETCREFLQIIHDESLRLQRLVSDILDLSRIESKQLELKGEKVPIDRIIETAVKTVEEQMRKRKISLDVLLPESFPVYVDKDRFRQILLNLLTNAMAYTPEGGRITVEARRESNSWWIRVADTGVGIPEEDLPRIFERFYRVDKARSRESGGTGLGLAIVKHLVEVHQGEIRVNSRVGEGTEFQLIFPIKTEDEKSES
jgi:two-component system phosphate regulon sensor histidine kinase PhoR